MFFKKCSVTPFLEPDLVPGSVVRAFVTQPLHLEILVALFEFVEEVCRRLKCLRVLVNRCSEPAGWPSNHTHECGLRNVSETML
jgi:hypothetical protein